MRQLIETVCPAVVLLLVHASYGQSSLSALPGYDRYKEVESVVRALRTEGRARVNQWSEDGKSMTFNRGGEEYALSLVDMSINEVTEETESEGDTQASSSRRSSRPGRATQDRPGRARQATWVTSPDGKWIARYRDYNVMLEPVDEASEESEGEKKDTNSAKKTAEQAAGPEAIAVTTGGSKDFRYGTCCWVYGEELYQSTAMWWSPDSRKLAFYEVDERHMRNYYLTGDNTDLYTQVLVERYPKPGTDNPYVGLLIYDLETKETMRVEVGGSRQQYVYNVRFTPDGKELLFSRTNRHQSLLEVLAADPVTGKSHVVVTEKQETWQANKPKMQFLEDGERFIWETERTGWRHFELRHLDGRLLNRLSADASYPAGSIVKVDEEANWFYYTACSGSNPNNAHLHRVRLDGTGHARLTSEPLHHSGFTISPDHHWFVASYEAVGEPPETTLFDMAGSRKAVLARPDMEKLRKAKDAGLCYGELFTFKADDETTDLFGILHKPSNFDPEKKYPLVISVYGGPNSRGLTNRFSAADPYCEFGFLVAKIANRGTTGRGKSFESTTYLKLGGPDIKDQADGVKYLSQRSYVDATRVGIYGHSYGGYMSCLALVKYPDLFHVGVAGAPVTDWKNYDTIYTERYMRTPQENPDGYREGSCLTYAKDLKGKLLIMHGLIDDNVHPANTWQLIDRFQRENLRFDMLIYPRSKHGLGSGSSAIRWEYLCKHLQPEPFR